jgi:hypothetical protein
MDPTTFALNISKLYKTGCLSEIKVEIDDQKIVRYKRSGMVTAWSFKGFNRRECVLPGLTKPLPDADIDENQFFSELFKIQARSYFFSITQGINMDVARMVLGMKNSQMTRLLTPQEITQIPKVVVFVE